MERENKFLRSLLYCSVSFSRRVFVSYPDIRRELCVGRCLEIAQTREETRRNNRRIFWDRFQVL